MEGKEIKTVKNTDEDIEVLCEAPIFDETNDCENTIGTHTLSYVYPQDCEIVRNGGGSACAFLDTIVICDDCYRYYKGGEDEKSDIEDINWEEDYVLDYQEEVE